MPTEHTVTLYAFKELEGEAKKRALEELERREGEMLDLDDWAEMCIDELKERGFRERFIEEMKDEKIAGKFTGKKVARKRRTEPDFCYSLAHPPAQHTATYELHEGRIRRICDACGGVVPVR